MDPLKIARSFDREIILSMQEARPFLAQIKTTRCSFCQADMSREPIRGYMPHSAGWTVKGFPQKLWLYVKCPNCGYDWAIWKLGVKRE